MFGRGLPVVAFGEQQCDEGVGWTTVDSSARYGNDLTECSHTEQSGSPPAVDVTLFGINLKSSGQHQHYMSNLIEKR